MTVEFVDAIDNSSMFMFGADGTVPIPEAGDTFITPDGQQFEVVKRAFVCEKRPTVQADTVDLSKPGAFTIDINMRVAVVTQEQLPKYLEEVRKANNARA